MSCLRIPKPHCSASPSAQFPCQSSYPIFRKPTSIGMGLMLIKAHKKWLPERPGLTTGFNPSYPRDLPPSDGATMGVSSIMPSQPVTITRLLPLVPVTRSISIAMDPRVDGRPAEWSPCRVICVSSFSRFAPSYRRLPVLDSLNTDPSFPELLSSCLSTSLRSVRKFPFSLFYLLT